MLASKQANGVKGRPRGVAGYSSPGKRNKRSVWTVPTKPYKGAHFAVFPLDLITPCILAGSRPGDLILDPFGGSGTTAQAAGNLHREAIICELNPSYIPLIEERTQQEL
jgi:DNA modification methylase